MFREGAKTNHVIEIPIRKEKAQGEKDNLRMRNYPLARKFAFRWIIDAEKNQLFCGNWSHKASDLRACM